MLSYYCLSQPGEYLTVLVQIRPSKSDHVGCHLTSDANGCAARVLFPLAMAGPLSKGAIAAEEVIARMV